MGVCSLKATMDIKGVQYYHSGSVNYNDNGRNNGRTCANGVHVYCQSDTHRSRKQDFSSAQECFGSDLSLVTVTSLLS